MFKNKIIICSLLATFLLSVVGCKDLPGTKEQQGAVIGGLGGAAAGAAIGGKHPLLGAILGGAIGAGGGYVIGANSDKITGKDTQGAAQAHQNAQANPATAAQVRNSTTADLNNDGFVTLDEVVAMKQAGLSDREMISRMKATGQVFELSSEQQQYLRDRGVSQNVITQMDSINQDKKQQLLNNQRGEVIGRSPSSTTTR